MNSAFGTHTLLQQRTLDGISDSLDWLGVFHTASECASDCYKSHEAPRTTDLVSRTVASA